MTAKWQYKQAYEGVLEEVRSLKAENAKLRACLGDGCADCAVGMGEYADRLCDPIKSENAKLRELCADMWRDIPKTESCGWDMSTNTCTGSDECIGECSYWYRMRDLGIEVDDS